MAGCTCENWSLQDLSSALQDMHKDNKRIGGRIIGMSYIKA